MTHTDFIQILSDFVRYYPLPADPLNRCERLQCFALLEDPSQVLDSNFGQSIHETDFFFSRAWEDSGSPSTAIEVDHPSMTAVLYQVLPRDMFTQAPGKMVFYYDILISDILSDQKETAFHSGCDARNENQIVDQCARFFSAFFLYLRGIIKVKNINPPAGQTWGHRQLWEALDSQGQVSWEEDIQATKHFKTVNRQLNEEAGPGQRWKSGNRVGINLSLAVEIDYCGEYVLDLSKTAFVINRNKIQIKA